MARIRSIKPEFPQSESMGRVSREARLCFVLLWTLADDAGRLRGNSRMLASLLFPYDDDAPSLMDGWLNELAKEGTIRRYALDSDQYIEVCNWLKHQKIDKPSASKLPSFADSSPKARRNLGESSRTFVVGREGNGREGNGVDGNGVHPRANPAPRASPRRAAAAFASADFERFWGEYPKKRAKGDAEKAWRKLSPSHEMTEQIIAALSVAKTTDEWGRDGGRYIPHPATWLNQKGWLDDIVSQQQHSDFGEVLR